MPAASPRASASMIMRPMPCSAPMNSPTITPISEKEIAGVSEANSQAMVEGTITVRVTCHSPAPSRRAALMWSRSTERAPSNVLKNTRKMTTSQAVTILEASPMPKARMMMGASAMRGIELKAVM